jgi:hypothetical protein
MEELENLVMVIYEDDSFERDPQKRRREILGVVESAIDESDQASAEAQE